jgi:hypothetical protein
MTTETEDNKSTVFERHAQTVLGAVVVAILGWSGFTLNNLSVSVAQLTERVSAIQGNMTILQSQTTDRYTRQDAVRDLGAVQRSLEDHTSRIRALESKQ